MKKYGLYADTRKLCSFRTLREAKTEKSEYHGRPIFDILYIKKEF